MSLIVSMIIALLNTLLNHTMLTSKKSIRFCIATFIANSLVVNIALVGARYLFTDIRVMKYVFCVIMFLYIGYIYIVFEESFSKKIFVMFSTWVVSGIVFNVSIIVAGLIGESGSSELIIYVSRISMQLLLLLIASRPWFRKNYQKTLLLVSDRIIRWMSIYMIIAFLLLINNMTYDTTIRIGFRNFSDIYDFLLFYVFIILGYVVVFTGISSSSKMVLLQQSVELAEKKSEMHFKLANIDSLTDVASRLSILDQISKALILHQKSNEKFAVLMLDIDKFKLINDNFGHQAGDDVLKYLAKEISKCLKSSDTIGRVGGDEFVVILRQIQSNEEVEKMIKEIFNQLERPYFIDNQQMQINISIGISIYPEDAVVVDHLLNHADHAMYQAKTVDGNSFVFH